MCSFVGPCSCCPSAVTVSALLGLHEVVAASLIGASVGVGLCLPSVVKCAKLSLSGPPAF